MISLFTDGFDREYYIREVGKLIKISPRTAQLILEDLENKGIIESKTKGKIKTYKLKASELSRRYLVFVEQYKSIAFMEKSLLIKEVIERITPFVEGIGVIFGTYAKGAAGKDSDLDIFVAGTYEREEVKKVSKTFGIEVSVKCYPPKTFDKNYLKDPLLREILKNHVIFLNAERFVQTVMRNG